MAPDKSIIRKMAELAALSLEDSELDGFARDLDNIIGYMEKIASIDTGDAKPMEHILPLKNVLRDDIPMGSPEREEMVRNAMTVENGCFKVPNVVDAL